MLNSSDFSIAKRFRNLLPVVVDVETGGLNPQTDALLEIAAVMLEYDKDGNLCVGTTHFCHVMPFLGAHIDPEALQINGIDPYHPFRFAVEEAEALQTIFQPIQTATSQHRCERAVLVGHNANFDLSFMQAACQRQKVRSPFHRFTTFDTASLAALTLGETVLVKAVQAAGIGFDPAQAHSAVYDAQKTAQLFCWMVNRWRQFENNRK